jgi:endonuclease-3 related protein
VERALATCAAGGAAPEGFYRSWKAEIAALIRPSGYFNAKARKLKAFVEMLHERFVGDLSRLLALPVDDLRALLLTTHGIGPETADSIVLYAAEKPSFVIDAYTRRMFSRIGVTPGPSIPQGERGYEGWRRLFMEALPADAALYNEYHALIVTHGRRCAGRSRDAWDARCVRCARPDGARLRAGPVTSLGRHKVDGDEVK